VTVAIGGDVATPSETLRDDGDLVLSRRRSGRAPLLTLSVAARHPARGVVQRLRREYSLRGELDSAWAVRPIDLLEEEGRAVVTLEDPGGQLVSGLVGHSLDVRALLRIAIGAAASVGRAHERGLVHRDLKPANILTDPTTGRAWLMGFGLASRLPRERRPPDPPQVIEGTLAYMAPEQTGRMNRSVDARSDLYSLGVTLYELFTGKLPFEASDAMGWLHCHLAQTAARADVRRRDVPAQLGAIVEKLLAKSPESRYQTATGLESDLRRCIESIDGIGRVSEFPLGTVDLPAGLVIPEKLYGREREIETLVAAFDRVVCTGEPEAVLISGHSGIGKSSVVYELHRALVPRRGYFASGKFDQYKRDIPYATLAQAFGSLVRMILAESEAELRRWRALILEALGPNGRLLTDLIPELELVLGPQPPVPELAPGDAQNRFQMVFAQFIGAFARPEHPIVLFLDDLQWLDAATLKLMERLVVKRERMHLLLVGAYRSNEIQGVHPLALAIDAMRRSSTPLHDVRLSALGPDDVRHLVADALRTDVSVVGQLAALVWEKTQGNPFFAIEFLTELAHERLLVRATADRTWSWDRDGILAKGYTDNVVDLMTTKIERLAARSQRVLKSLACLGSASGAALAMVSDSSLAAIGDDLWDPVRLGLLRRSGDSYIFVHDRVMEAAYALIPEQNRPEAHLRIGRALQANLGPDAPADDVFDVANQLNRAVELIDQPFERGSLCRLNVLAGRKARAAVAYQSARNYFAQATALLPSDAWTVSYRETFELHLHLSECEYLVSHFERADELFDVMLAHARSKFDCAEVYELRMKLYQVAGKYDAGVSVALDALALFGVTFPDTESGIDAAIAEELRAIPGNLGGRRPADLATAPEADDPAVRTIINLLVGSIPCAYIGRPRLFPLLTQKAVNYSLLHGNTEQSPFAYGVYAVMLVSLIADIPRAYEFSTMSLRLNERFANARLHGTLLHLHADHVLFWRRHFAEGVPILRQAFTACQEVGDLVYAGFLAFETVWQFIEGGDALDDVLAQSGRYQQFAQNSNNKAVYETIRLEQQFVASLQGKTADPLGMRDGEFDEEASFAAVVNATFGCGIVFYHIMKQVLAFLHGQYTEALAAARRAEPVLGAAMAMPIEATYHVFHALTLAALLPTASSRERDEYAGLLATARTKIAMWAENCPENFASRHALLAAEMARLEGREFEAMRAYEDAVQSAREHGFVQYEALALELAAQFYEARGLETSARAHFREARDRYLRWGAHAKVWQLERLHPYLRTADERVPPTATMGASVDELDLATVVRTMRALTSEIVLESWTTKALTIALEEAGARRGVLLVLGNGDLRSLAEATVTASGVDVRMLEAPAVLPDMVLRYVERTREAVVLDDASLPNEFSRDPYIAGGRIRSILCLPLAKQDALRGVLYLENDLAPGAFTPRRTALLKLLASQAAMSLENVWLHSDLQRENESRRRTEAALRRSEMFLAEAQRLSHTGSFGWIPSTDEIQWSEESYRITGIERGTAPTLDEIIARMHPEDAPQVRETLLRASQTGGSLDYEHRYVMPDESIRFVRIIARSVHEPGMPIEYVGAITDITERREAAAALQNTQAELAHVMRVSALGELAASIAHEVSQPLSAISADATAALNWLGFQPPNIEGVSEALTAIDADCQRAGSVLSRINALLKRAPFQRTTCDLNAIVAGIVPLVRPQFDAKGVALEIELDRDLPSILGDSVQLQQVLINLLLNAADACRSLETERRRVVIRTATEPRGGETWSVASVADTGNGIEPAALARIFQAFYTTKSSGLGMGLSISRSIVLRHDGELVASHNLPNGAIFAVRLPSLP
jgi:predicted ATPase/signal transduction histidine kinase